MLPLRDNLRAESVKVTQFLPERGFVGVGHDGQPARLYLREKELLKLLRRAHRADASTSGEQTSKTETAARLLVISLGESLETEQPAPSRWWECTGYRFAPPLPIELPPLSTHDPSRRWPIRSGSLLLPIAVLNGVPAFLDHSWLRGALAGAALVAGALALWLALRERRRRAERPSN